jgi:tetratricopeptide (TPR) repeat protein
VNAGDPGVLGTESEKALRLFTEVGDPWGTGISSQLRSEWLTLSGRLEEALTVTDDGLQVVAGMASVSDLLQQRAQGVGILLRLDRLAEARTRASDMESLAVADGSVRALTQARMSVAQVEIASGDGEAALRQVEQISVEGAFPEQVMAWYTALRAEALLLLDRPDEARAALREALPQAARARDHPVVATVLVAVAGWNAAAERFDMARESLARADAIRGADDELDPFRRWVGERLGADTGEVPASAPGIPSALLGVVDADVLTALLD